MKIVENILKKVERTLSFLGGIINQNLTKEENKKAYSGQTNKFNFDGNGNSFKISKKEKEKPKEVYSHKGSGYKGKGSINRESATFNKPRKGLFPGRNH
jgi:hypothetical protein